MGITDFFKKLMENRHEEPIYLKYENLGSWFEKQADIIRQDFEEEIKNTNKEIEETTKRIEELTKTLEEAELKNQKIPEKAKHFMEGNRKTYIRITKFFVQGINIDENADKFSEFFDKYEKNIAEYTKNTQRPYLVLQEFFANESRAIALEIKQIDNTIKTLKKDFKERKVNEIELLKLKFAHFKSKKSLAANSEQEISKLKAEIKEQENRIKEIEEEKQGILKSDEHKEMEMLDKIHDNLHNKLKEKELEVLHHFSVIEAALRRYERTAMDNICWIEEYLDSSTKAFSKDKELVINKILFDLKNSLEKGIIDVKDKKKDKTIREIGLMSKERMKTLWESHNSLKEDIKENTERREQNKTGDRLKKIKNDSGKLKDLIGRSKQRISESDNLVKHFDEETEKAELFNETRKITRKNIVVDDGKRE